MVYHPNPQYLTIVYKCCGISKNNIKTSTILLTMVKDKNSVLGKKGKITLTREDPLRQKIIQTLATINDPEIGIDIWTLGLIYDIIINKDTVHINMTLTTPLCPFGPTMIEQVRTKVQKIAGKRNVEVELVFEPAWTPSQELRTMLGV
jgi:metal-sulfur cluster biosynthetic enzyme